MTDWTALMAPVAEELGRWAAQGLAPVFWWRDDDLVGHSPALNRAMEWSNRLELPGLFAIIPGQADLVLRDIMMRCPALQVAQHGWMHRNAEPSGRQNGEFGASRVMADGLADLQRGHVRMREIFGEAFSPVFVPPWNRLDDRFLPFLESLGFRGLSTYGHRSRPAIGKCACVNSHLDIMDWSAPAVPVLPYEFLVKKLGETLAQKREDRAIADEPIGILTHHRVMLDDRGWEFLSALVQVTRNNNGRWASPAELFTVAPPPRERVMLQPVAEIDQSYVVPDPWDYRSTDDDSVRARQILSHIPQRNYGRTLEIGCGNGFLTLRLPGEEVVGIDVSERAIGHAQQAAMETSSPNRFSFITGGLSDISSEHMGKFDLIVIAGVLYEHYIGEAWSIISSILDDLLNPDAIVVTCHVDRWVMGDLPFNLVRDTKFAYRQYVQALKVFHR